MEGLLRPGAAPFSSFPTRSSISQANYENDESLPIAQLLTIDVCRLERGEEEEAAKLFKASKEDGALYLDFSDQRSMKMMEMVGQIFAVSKDIFDMSLEEKMKYDVDLRGALKLNGEPPVLTQAFPHVSSFSAEINMVLSLLLSSLSTSLNLRDGHSLAALHRPDVTSSDIIRLLHYVSQPGTETGSPQTPHTDLGSLTILFTGSPGLQVLKPQSEDWAFVLPKPNCAVVNIGDGMCTSAQLGLASVKGCVSSLPWGTSRIGKAS
ncbi:MAG: hypothetical protein Q9195_004650 [Heterodermia aff. obscurata]